MKKTIVLVILCLESFILNAQTQITFKPNAIIGKDASIWKLRNQCVANGMDLTPEIMNFGSEPNLNVLKWTYYGAECDTGTVRSLLRFDELNSIPQNALIISAELILYGTSTDQNTCFPGQPSGFYDNSVVISRIINHWDEESVTWNTQPSITPINSFTIPQSLLRYNWNYSNNSNNLKAMVQYMVAHPNENYGFMLQLQNETNVYRAMTFASSDNGNTSLWPELKVTYTTSPCDFSFCLNNSDGQTHYNFQSETTGGEHTWTYDNQIISNSPSFTYVFPTDDYNISTGLCHTVVSLSGEECTQCMKFCPVDISEESTCGANFSICLNNSIERTTFTFISDILDGEHKWIDSVNGQVLSNSPSFTYVFQQTGSQTLCHTFNDDCTKCISFCVGDIPYNYSFKQMQASMPIDVKQGKILTGDIVEWENNIMIYPNPTNSNWTFMINSLKEETIELFIMNMEGKQIYYSKETLNVGENIFNLGNNSYDKGTYILKIKGSMTNYSQKMVKE